MVRCKQYILDKIMFDRCALVLKTNLVNWGPKSFRTLDVWQTNRHFRDSLERQWKNYIG